VRASRSSLSFHLFLTPRESLLQGPSAGPVESFFDARVSLDWHRFRVLLPAGRFGWVSSGPIFPPSFFPWSYLSSHNVPLFLFEVLFFLKLFLPRLFPAMTVSGIFPGNFPERFRTFLLWSDAVFVPSFSRFQVFRRSLVVVGRCLTDFPPQVPSLSHFCFFA